MRQLLIACLVVALIAVVIWSSENVPVETSAPYPQRTHLISSIGDVFRHL